MTLNQNKIWKFGTLSVSPFNWLEASYFYYRPSDLIWYGTGARGHYLDKGFNIKFIYKSKHNDKPKLAIGLDDFAGTGYFTKEYIVLTQDLNNIKATMGVGWGRFAGKKDFENPLSFISESFIDRPRTSDNFDLGGRLSYDQYFRGNASIIAGLEYFSPKIKGLSFKLEHDPFDYIDFSARGRPDANLKIRKKDSYLNFGLSYKYNKFFTFDFSYIKGNTVNFSFTIGTNFNKRLQRKPDFNPTITTKENNKKSKTIFYEDLLYNLNNNNLFLQTASLSDDKLDISISTSEHRNAIRSSSYAASVARDISKIHKIDINQINVSHINAGIELNQISYISSHLNKKDFPKELVIRNTKLNSGSPDGFYNDEFRPMIKFPVIFSSISPTLISHIGNPEKFFFGGVNIQHVSEIQFKRNLLLTSEINFRAYDTFEDTISGSNSVMEHVRTDIVDYLKEDDVYITRMQLDYITSLHKDIYLKLSGGIFETMYAGIGFEALYKPFNKNYSIGLELFNVRQRSYNQKFSLREYKTSTGHINFGYLLPLGIETNLSLGRYLAKDDGYTFDIGRRTKSGFKAGIYFTRTNISSEIFGEGSFDKGFYIQIPMDLITKNYTGNYSSFKISPLTRDGGAKLIHDKDLRGLIYNSTFNELINQWEGFLN